MKIKDIHKLEAEIIRSAPIKEDIATVKCTFYPISIIDFNRKKALLKTSVSSSILHEDGRIELEDDTDRSFWVDFKYLNFAIR